MNRHSPNHRVPHSSARKRMASKGRHPFGAGSLDEHHWGIDSLFELLLFGLKIQQDDLAAKILAEIVRCMAFHFGEEDRLLEGSGCEEVGEFRREHAELLARASTLTARRQPLDVRTFHALRALWRRHVLFRRKSFTKMEKKEG